jgi:hypothetical protein
MALGSEAIVDMFKQRGLRVTIVSVASVLAFGIVDQFSARIIPAIVTQVDSYVNPPKFFIRFVPPVDVSGGLVLTGIDSEPPVQIAVKESGAGLQMFRAQAGAGNYVLHLRGGSDKAGKVLVDSTRIQSPGDTWKIDTSDARLWAAARDLGMARDGQPGQQAPQPAATSASSAGAAALTATRWPAAAPDFAVVATVQDPILRSMLANALAEVGLFEKGSEWEQRRVLSYWTGVMNVTSTDFPWSGAFIAWVARQASLEPVSQAQLVARWKEWNEEVAEPNMSPGMVAVFQPTGPTRSGLAGIVLRRQPNCIEVVMGNIADRVVISCVRANMLVSLRRPVSIRPDPKPVTREPTPRGE